MPRISNSTPVLFTIATSLTPKMFMIVIDDQRDDREDPLVVQAVRESQPMLLNAGISASGSVTQTAVTVRIPAKR